MEKIQSMEWLQANTESPKEYKCGFCQREIASNHGYHNRNSNQPVTSIIYICPNCGCPTFFYNGKQYPEASNVRVIEKLPSDIKEVYYEICEDTKNACYTSALLLGRKLLMHLAVDVCGADEGKSFVEYVNILKDSGYIPPNGNKFLEKLRLLGNEKNHELKLGNKEEVDLILKFLELLLIFIYEYSDEIEPVSGS